MSEFEPNAGMNDALAKIERGARELVRAAHVHIGEVLDYLEQGDFSMAEAHLKGIASLISPLAQAQRQIGVAAQAVLVRSSDLKAGMELPGLGVIDDVREAECESADCTGHILVDVDSKQIVFSTTQYIYVKAEET